MAKCEPCDHYNPVSLWDTLCWGNSLKLLQDRSTIELHEDNHSKKISPVKETEGKHHDTAPFTVAAVGNHTVEISK